MKMWRVDIVDDKRLSAPYEIEVTRFSDRRYWVKNNDPLFDHDEWPFYHENWHQRLTSTRRVHETEQESRSWCHAWYDQRINELNLDINRLRVHQRLCE